MNYNNCKLKVIWYYHGYSFSLDSSFMTSVLPGKRDCLICSISSILVSVGKDWCLSWVTSITSLSLVFCWLAKLSQLMLFVNAFWSFVSSFFRLDFRISRRPFGSCPSGYFSSSSKLLDDYITDWEIEFFSDFMEEDYFREALDDEWCIIKRPGP